MAPLAAVLTSSPANAAETMTISAYEHGSGAPVPGACYTVQDLGRGGGIAADCDEDHDGVVVLTSSDPCTDCRVHQHLPNLSPGVPTAHLLAAPQDGGWEPTYTFHNYLKPYLRLRYRDAHTGSPVRGACLGINETEVPGAVYAGCDGDQPGGAGDQDGVANGAVQTRRLGKAGNYTVTTTRVPTGYLKPAPVDLSAPPARTGEVVTHAFDMLGRSGISVRTVDARRPKRLVKGACYKVTDRTLGARLGTFCDGQNGGLAGDLDRRKNGVVKLGRLPGAHSYVFDQTRVPRTYRLTKANKTVLTVVDKTVGLTVKSRRR